MTWDEVEHNLVELLSNPDAGLEKQNKFIQDLQKDYLTHDSLAAEIRKNEERIKALQTTNANLAQKLFTVLDVSKAKENTPEEEPEENPMETPDDLDRFLTTLATDKEE